MKTANTPVQFKVVVVKSIWLLPGAEYSDSLIWEPSNVQKNMHVIHSADSLFYFLKQYYQQESAKLRNQIQMLQNTNR